MKATLLLMLFFLIVNQAVAQNNTADPECHLLSGGSFVPFLPGYIQIHQAR
jgi:hypothetical protein